LVANPEITPFSGYVRVGGQPTGLWETKISRPATLDECIGEDSVKPEFLQAIWAFIGTFF
jgi:hypothetical protein